MPFISISAPSIVSGMSGESEKQLRETFEEAAVRSPSLSTSRPGIGPLTFWSHREMRRVSFSLMRLMLSRRSERTLSARWNAGSSPNCLLAWTVSLASSPPYRFSTDKELYARPVMGQDGQQARHGHRCDEPTRLARSCPSTRGSLRCRNHNGSARRSGSREVIHSIAAENHNAMLTSVRITGSCAFKWAN